MLLVDQQISTRQAAHCQMVWLHQGTLPNHQSRALRTKGSPRYATPTPAAQAPARPRGPQPAQRPAQARPQATARPGAALVQSAGSAQANRQAVAASVQSRAQFIPGSAAAVNPVTSLIPGHAQVISHPPQAVTVSSDLELLKIRLDQAESAKKILEKELDKRDEALKSAQRTQTDMAKMLGERKGEIDNAKWQIEDLEMTKAELEKELAKKKLATTSDEGLAVQAASDKKALEEGMRQKEESARRAEKKLLEGEDLFKTAEARATAVERQLAEAKGEVQTLTTELSSEKKLFKQAEGEVEWLRVELKQQTKVVAQAQREVAELRSEVGDQKKLYSDAKNEASHLRGDLSSLNATVDELEASNSARMAQIATLEQEKQTMEAEMTKLTKRFNDSLHAANAAKKEIEDQKLEAALKSIASTKSIAVVAQEQVEQTKAEEQESNPGIISRADHRAERKASSLQRWLASLMVILTLIAILQPVLATPAVKMFFQNHALTGNFFQQEQNQSVVKDDSTWTQPEATPAITSTSMTTTAPILPSTVILFLARPPLLHNLHLVRLLRS